MEPTMMEKVSWETLNVKRAWARRAIDQQYALKDGGGFDDTEQEVIERAWGWSHCLPRAAGQYCDCERPTVTSVEDLEELLLWAAQRVDADAGCQRGRYVAGGKLGVHENVYVWSQERVRDESIQDEEVMRHTFRWGWTSDGYTIIDAAGRSLRGARAESYQKALCLAIDQTVAWKPERFA